MDRGNLIDALALIAWNSEPKNAQTITEAISLLKEQKAVEPKVEKAILDYQSWHYICGDCGGQIDIQDNYCRHCGRVVAHLSNKI